MTAHGTLGGYDRCTAGPDGGTCAECRAARADHQRAWRARQPKRPPRPRLVQVWTSLDPDLWAELDRRASARGTTVSQVLREVVAQVVPAPPPQVKGARQ